MKSKFYEVYNLIMEELLQNKSGAPIKLNQGDEEYKSALNDIQNIVNKFTEMLKLEFQNDLLKNEKFESFSKDKVYIIKCPRRLREKFMKKTPFLSEKISNEIENGSLINDNFIIKINDVKKDDTDAKKSFDDIKNDVDDIKYQKTGKSSVGEYDIPIIIQSEENDDDFYKFNIKLYAKPNTGATANREGNVSITLAEFIPCLLWNIKAPINISIDEIINLIKNYDLNESKYAVHEKSKVKIQALINYFKNNNDISKLIKNKIYGVIGIYKFMIKTFSKYIGNECIWTDIDALKPPKYENNPGDIMINKGDGKYISISLKTAEKESDSPPIANPTVGSFLKYCNNISDIDINLKKDYYQPILNFAIKNKIFTDDEIKSLKYFENAPLKMSTYINNSDVAKKCLEKGPIRSFAINKLIEIINTVFKNKEDLMNYFLQVQKGDPDFYILKAIEKDGLDPKQISLNYVIKNDFEIKASETSIIISGFTINGNDYKIIIDVRSKGHGLHAFLAYDLVSKLK